MKKFKMAIVDTMFSRVDMAKFALLALEKFPDVEITKSTVPGIKDLAVECSRLLAKNDIAIALGWVGGAEIDTQCAHEASIGIQLAKMKHDRHILEVFIFENEGKNEKDLLAIAKNRASKHALNAYYLLADKSKLQKNAGMGIRQGREDAGRIG